MGHPLLKIRGEWAGFKGDVPFCLWILIGTYEVLKKSIGKTCAIGYIVSYRGNNNLNFEGGML